MIKEVRLKNVFNHKDTTLEFGKGINLIVGPNGSGKTSIVEAAFFGFFCDTFKGKKLQDLTFGFSKSAASAVEVKTSNFVVKRNVLTPGEDVFIWERGIVRGRENVTRMVEKNFVDKHFFKNVVYTSQETLTDVVNLTPSEKAKFVDKLLNLQYVSEFAKALNRVLGEVVDRKNEYVTFLTSSEKFKQEKKEALERELALVVERLKQVKERLSVVDDLLAKFSLAESYEIKKGLLQEYLTLRTQRSKVNKAEELLENVRQRLTQCESEVARSLQYREERLRELKKINGLIAKSCCPTCERPFTEVDRSLYQQRIEEVTREVQKVEESLRKYQELAVKLKGDVRKLQEVVRKKSEVYAELKAVKQKVLSLPPLAVLRRVGVSLQGLSKDDLEREKEALIKELEVLSAKKSEVEGALKVLVSEDEVKVVKTKLSKLELAEGELLSVKQFFDKVDVVKEVRHALLSQSGVKQVFDVFDLGSLSYDKNFDFYVDGIPIHLCAGSQKVALAIAIKIAFLRLNNQRFLILDEPTVFLDEKRIEDLMSVLTMAYEKGFVDQVVVISHEPRLKEVAHRVVKVEKKDGIAKLFVER